MLLLFSSPFQAGGGLQLVIVEACGEAAQRRSNTCKGPIRFSRGESGNCLTEEVENLLKSWL